MRHGAMPDSRDSIPVVVRAPVDSRSRLGAPVGQGNGIRRGGFRRRTAVIALCLVPVAGALWSSAPAFGLIHRGHAFSFAVEGEKSEKLSKPSGVAVSAASGDVYVVDAGNNRIERFGTAGEFIAAWGWGVGDGKAEYEVCTSACKDGLAGSGEAQFDNPEAIAIDNSTSGSDPSKGDVYVISDRVSVNNNIEKFTSAGASLGRLSSSELSSVGGIAVDSTGIVWVWDNEQGAVGSFDNAEPNKPRPGIPVEESVSACGAPGFAVDAVGEALYVNHQRENFEEECPEGAPSSKDPAVTGKVAIDGEPQVGVALIPALDDENTSAVAVDLSTATQASGDVYLDNVTSVGAFTSAGALIQRFGAEAELTKGRGVAVDPQRGEVLVADAGKNRVDVFGPKPAGAPMVDSISSQNIDPTSTHVEAQVDANGIDAHSYFQYGTVDCSITPASCTDVPAAPGADIGSGFGDVSVQATLTGLQPGTAYFLRVVAENENGEQAEGAQTLSTFTTLPNPVGLLQDGRAWELVSPPEKGGSGIEAIGGIGGPAGGIMEASEDGGAVTYVADGPIEPEPEGNRSPEGTQVFSTRSPEAWSSKSIVTPNRHGEGFPSGKPQEYQLFSSNLAFALVEPWGFEQPLQDPPLVPGVEVEERGIYRRNNATCEAVPATCFQPLITAENDTRQTPFGGEVGIIRGGGVISATADLNHVVFQSEVALTGPKPKPSEEELARLYEWSAGSPPSEQLKFVSVLPSGKTAQAPVLGDNIQIGTDARNAISADGSRVFWTETEEGREENIKSLYVRDTVKGETLKINAPAPGVKLTKLEEEEAEEVHFQFASTDGSRVFFTDTVSLTAESQLRTAREGPSDLYECDLAEVEGELHCSLTDLTVDPRSQFGGTADVVGVAIGASEDGSSVYFVANGVLSSNAASRGAQPGECIRPTSAAEPSQTAECNLYFEHFDSKAGSWEEPRFIAALSQEDAPDWGTTGTRSLAGLTARVSPNGRYLAFMSNRSLTGYDNVDANPEAAGARDEEVFLYDAQSQGLTCASCRPGSRPHGVHDVKQSGEGLGLVVDRPGVWRSVGGGKWLAGSIPGWTPLEPNSAPYQSRYLTDNGRVFFNGNDALVEQDTNGKEDVYEFEPEGVGNCERSSGCVSLISSGVSANESAFIDASASGNDVFFLTAGQLVGTDKDNSFDLYDARVCSASSPCVKPPPPPPAPCGSEQSCRPPAPAPPGFGAPGSATFTGPGNVAKDETLAAKSTGAPKPLTKAQKLAKALSTCRKKFKHAKKKRLACQAQARKKYGTKKPKAHGKRSAGKKR